MPPPARRPTRSQIFGDDSSKTGHEYFVYGSLHVNQNQFRKVEASLRAALEDYPHEIKWTAVRFTKVNVRFLNALMQHWTSVSYRCIVVPSEQINQAAKSTERALLRAKLIHHHLKSYARSTLQPEPEFYVTLDEDDFDPEVQQITLNRMFWRDFGGDYDAFKVRAGSSKEHGMLQAADLITGAVAWVWNGGLDGDPDSNAYRHHHLLASIIAKRTRIAGFKKKGQPAVPQGDVRTLGRYTVKQLEKGFRIWRLDLSKSAHWNVPKADPIPATSPAKRARRVIPSAEQTIEQQERREILRRLENLERLLPKGIGHNRPPPGEEITEESITGIVREAAAIIREELQRPEPDAQKVTQAGSRLDRTQKWIADKIDEGAKGYAKKIGEAAAVATVLAAAANYPALKQALGEVVHHVSAWLTAFLAAL